MNSRVLPAATAAIGALMILSLPVVPMPVRAQAQSPQGRPHGPPPEAIAACQGQAVGAKVSFRGRRGETLTGTCESVDGVLAARPDGPPPRDGAASPAK